MAENNDYSNFKYSLVPERTISAWAQAVHAVELVHDFQGFTQLTQVLVDESRYCVEVHAC